MRFTGTLIALALVLSHPARAADEPFVVKVHVHADRARGELKPIWRFFGADEPNYAYMKDGRKLLGELGELRPEAVYFRAHNLLTTGDGTPALKWGSTNAYTEDAAGKPVYDWTIVDRIFDAYRGNHVRPYVQLGFMPKALSRKPEPYQHKWTPKARYDEIYTGWAYPPTDYAKWGELAFELARHCADKYGRDEVGNWYWETWNEPNIGYWRGTPEEFFKLHDYAVDGVRRALPGARVGGPDMAGGAAKFLRAFLDHCLQGTNAATGKVGTPLDFISFHAKGAPRFVDGHVRMGIAEQLRTIDGALATIASYPQLKGKPVVIGESDPDGCAACQGPQLGYRNGTMYASYTAACFARKHELAARHAVNLAGALTWAFEFEEQPPFAGFRVLASNGIDLPVLNVFRMFARMGGQWLDADSDGAIPLDDILKSGVRGARADVSVLASRDGERICALLWHYHDDDLPGPAADVRLTLSGFAATATNAKAELFRIDDEHSNAFAAWKGMGSPQKPSAEEYAKLESAGKLTAGELSELAIKDGAATLALKLPRQGVMLLVVETAKR
jgi:xylan 1,4-beta-xylosidase